MSPAPAEALYMGLDIGTTNAKVVVLDSSGRLVSTGAAPVPVHHGDGGAVEQDLGEIREAARTSLATACSGAGAEARRIRALGVSSQGGALLLRDPRGRPRGPVVGWQDGRGAQWADRVAPDRSRAWVRRRIGSWSTGGCLGQIARLREEGALGGDTRVGWVGDAMVGWLCGRPAHDATSLSIAGLYNPTLGREDPEVLRLLGLESGRLPDLLDVRFAAGALLPEVARDIGLEPGLPVGPAVHDQYAAAIGCGATDHADVMFGAGTAWVLLSASRRKPRLMRGFSLVCRHPVPGLYGLLLSMVNGGSSLTWAIETLGLSALGGDEIDARLASVSPGSDGLRFRPLLVPAGGAGLPRSVAGRLDGIRLGHTASHVLRAVVEGLACELGRHLAMMEAGGLRAARLVMCGPAAAGAVTPGVIADVTGRFVDCVTVAETSAVGAAVLARLLVEPEAELARLAAEMKPPQRRVAPGPGRSTGARLLGEYQASLRRE